MNQKVNKIELSEKDYQGAPSSMCQGVVMMQFLHQYVDFYEVVLTRVL